MRFLASFGLAVFVAVGAEAGVTVYSGLSSERLYLQEAPALGKDVVLVKFEGIESKWGGKVIATKKRSATSGDRFSFDYDLELSSGVQKKAYELLVESGFEMKNGSRVKKIQVHYPEMSNQKPAVLVYDESLSKSSQKVDLIGSHKKAPFKPEVD